MAWTNPRTWTVGETVTKAIMDTHVRDNLNFLNTNDFGSYTASSTAAVTTATLTLVAFDAEVEESANLTHDNVTNNSRLVVGLAGLYQVEISTGWTANTSGFRAVLLRKNSGGSAAGGTALYQENVGASPAGAVSVQLVRTVRLAAADYLEVFRYQSSGGNLAPIAVMSSGTPAMATIRRVSA